jgi:hypothetical protein
MGDSLPPLFLILRFLPSTSTGGKPIKEVQRRHGAAAESEEEVMTITMHASTSETAIRARAILEKKIETGRASAKGLFERVFEQAPTDAIAKVDKLEFTAKPLFGGEEVQGGFHVAMNEVPYAIHRHALGQIAGRADVPPSYLSDLVGGHLWQRELASEILNKSFRQGHANERALVRSIGGQVRGFLSDRYRRLDSRPLLETFAATCQEIGAVPVDGTVSDVRVAMKALLPVVFEPVPGEVLCLGVEWGNSDFGAARHSVRAFILRLLCLNGATMEDALSQVHLGGRLSDDIEFSARTHILDTKASISALKDVVKGTLGPAKVETLLAGIKAADEKKVDWKRMRSTLAKKLLAGEIKAIEQSYQSEDVVMLPPGESIWRVSNAISWIAGQTEDADRKLELQRMAGHVINGKVDAAA